MNEREKGTYERDPSAVFCDHLLVRKVAHPSQQLGHRKVLAVLADEPSLTLPVRQTPPSGPTRSVVQFDPTIATADTRSDSLQLTSSRRQELPLPPRKLEPALEHPPHATDHPATGTELSHVGRDGLVSMVVPDVGVEHGFRLVRKLDAEEAVDVVRVVAEDVVGRFLFGRAEQKSGRGDKSASDENRVR